MKYLTGKLASDDEAFGMCDMYEYLVIKGLRCCRQRTALRYRKKITIH